MPVFGAGESLRLDSIKKQEMPIAPSDGFCLIRPKDALLAQQVDASVSEAGFCGFESRGGHHMPL